MKSRKIAESFKGEHVPQMLGITQEQYADLVRRKKIVPSRETGEVSYNALFELSNITGIGLGCLDYGREQ